MEGTDSDASGLNSTVRKFRKVTTSFKDPALHGTVYEDSYLQWSCRLVATCMNPSTHTPQASCPAAQTRPPWPATSAPFAKDPTIVSPYTLLLGSVDPPCAQSMPSP